MTYITRLQENSITVRESYCSLVIPCSYSTVIGLNS